MQSDIRRSNDTFLLTYSGHGGQLEDMNEDESSLNPRDRYDETWCLYDREFVDDELNVYLRDFKEGIRIFILSDSCHSGTVARGPYLQGKLGINTFKSNVDEKGKKYRFAPTEVLSRTYLQNKALYDGILKDIKYKEKEPIASIILISGCQDHELSQDDLTNGYFTGSLKKVWDDGAFKGSITAFHKLIYDKMMASEQHPNYFKDGKPSKPFEDARPFTI